MRVEARRPLPFAVDEPVDRGGGNSAQTRGDPKQTGPEDLPGALRPRPRIVSAAISYDNTLIAWFLPRLRFLGIF